MKLSSVLAAFETTIKKNNENSVSDGSFLTSSSSGERRSRTRRRRQVAEQQSCRPDAEKTSTKVCALPRHGQSPSKSSNNASSRGRSPRQHRPHHVGKGLDKAPLSPTRISPTAKLDEAYCSPTEETTDASSAGVPVPFETSPSSRNMHKIPNSLKREHSGEALIAAAQKAVTKFSPTKKGKNKMNASLPIMGNLSNCDFSFSSLPVILPTTGPPQHQTNKKDCSLQTKSKNHSIASAYLGNKSYPKSPVPKKGKLKSLKDFDSEPEACSDETSSVHSIYSYDPSRNSIKPRNPARASNSTLPPLNEGYDQGDCSDPVKLLSSKARPKGILLRRDHPVNRVRKVKFLDLQPGGGRRMSLESPNCRDSQPLRPRRSSLTIAHELGEANTKLAATKIQATFRGYLQWMKTRTELLERKLRRIECDHQLQLKKITEWKWLEMDALRNEVVEEDKRLDSQVELGNKLIEHLKRDSAMVRDQTKKLKEHCKSIRQNNEHCEQIAEVQNESMANWKRTLDQLQQHHEHLKEFEQDLAKKVRKNAKKRSLLSKSVKEEFDCKKSLEKATKKLVNTIHQRCHDDTLLSLISTLSLAFDPDDQSKNESKSSPVFVMVPNFDEQSGLSDTTEPYAGYPAKATRTICSGGNSFAEYDPALISPTPPPMPLIVEE